MSSFENHKSSQECSIIIPVYKRYDIVRSILLSFSNQTHVEYIKEIIICDSEKEDRTMRNVIDRCKPLFKDNIIKHIFVENNIAAKRNAGINEACAENIFFLDDDCVPTNDYIINHIKMLETSPNTIFCGIVEFDEHSKNLSNYIKYRSSRHGVNLSNFLVQSKYVENIDFTKIVTMNMSCKKKLLIENNLFFDEEFLGYGMEDNEFGWRVHKCGILIKQCEAKIIHNEIGDFNSFCKKIYHIARDGIPKFISKQKIAVWVIPFSKYLEANYPYHDTLGRITSWIIRNIIINKMSMIIKFYLEKTDKFDIMYFRLLYKYVLAYYYMRGVRERKRHFLTNSETKDGFYVKI